MKPAEALHYLENYGAQAAVPAPLQRHAARGAGGAGEGVREAERRRTRVSDARCPDVPAPDGDVTALRRALARSSSLSSPPVSDHPMGSGVGPSIVPYY